MSIEADQGNNQQTVIAFEMQRLLTEGTIFVDERLGAADEALVNALRNRERRPWDIQRRLAVRESAVALLAVGKTRSSDIRLSRVSGSQLVAIAGEEVAATYQRAIAGISSRDEQRAAHYIPLLAAARVQRTALSAFGTQLTPVEHRLRGIEESRILEVIKRPENKGMFGPKRKG